MIMGIKSIPKMRLKIWAEGTNPTMIKEVDINMPLDLANEILLYYNHLVMGQTDRLVFEVIRRHPMVEAMRNQK